MQLLAVDICTFRKEEGVACKVTRLAGFIERMKESL